MTLAIGNTWFCHTPQIRDTYIGIKNTFDVPNVPKVSEVPVYVYVYLSSESN